MEIGISTASFFIKKMNEDAILDLGAHGVSVCELFLNSFCEYEPDFIDLLECRIHESGIKVYSIHPMGLQFEPQLFSTHPRQRADAFYMYEKVLKICNRLGADHYVMHATLSLNGVNRFYQIDRLIPIFQELNEIASSYHVQLMLENVSWCVCSTPEAARAINEKMNGTLHFNLDTKQAVRMGYNPVEFIEAFGSNISNVHLCDAIISNDGSFDLKMPGKGNLNFLAIRDALKKVGYSGPAFIEVYSHMFSDLSELYDSRDRMQEIFKD